MEQCLKIILAAEERTVERNHRRKRAMQCKQRVPLFVVKVAGECFDELRLGLNRLIVHHQRTLKICRNQTDLLRILLELFQTFIPQMNQIFRFKRTVFSCAHAVDDTAESVHLGTVGNRRGIGFQIALRRGLPRLHFFNGFDLVQRTQIDGHGNIHDVRIQNDIAVKRSQIETRKLPHDQNVVIHSITIHPVSSFQSSCRVPVLSGMILFSEFIQIDITEIRTEYFSVIQFLRCKRFIHGIEEIRKEMN